MEKILEVNGLKKTFKLSAKQQKIEKTNEKVKVAVNHLSFTAYRGEVFGLLGSNGAGKTTTLRMLASPWLTATLMVLLPPTVLSTSLRLSRPVPMVRLPLRCMAAPSWAATLS